MRTYCHKTTTQLSELHYTPKLYGGNIQQKDGTVILSFCTQCKQQ